MRSASVSGPKIAGSFAASARKARGVHLVKVSSPPKTAGRVLGGDVPDMHGSCATVDWTFCNKTSGMNGNSVGIIGADSRYV